MKKIRIQLFVHALVAMISLGTGRAWAEGADKGSAQVAVERTKALMDKTRDLAKETAQRDKELRKARFLQRAATLALKKGRPGAALHLTRSAREKSRAALMDLRTEAAEVDEPDEFEGADEKDAHAFVKDLKKRIQSRMKKRRSVKKGEAKGDQEPTIQSTEDELIDSLVSDVDVADDIY